MRRSMSLRGSCRGRLNNKSGFYETVSSEPSRRRMHDAKPSADPSEVTQRHDAPQEGGQRPKKGPAELARRARAAPRRAGEGGVGRLAGRRGQPAKVLRRQLNTRPARRDPRHKGAVPLRFLRDLDGPVPARRTRVRVAAHGPTDEHRPGA